MRTQVRSICCSRRSSGRLRMPIERHGTAAWTARPNAAPTGQPYPDGQRPELRSQAQRGGKTRSLVCQPVDPEPGKSVDNLCITGSINSARERLKSALERQSQVTRSNAPGARTPNKNLALEGPINSALERLGRS